MSAQEEGVSAQGRGMSAQGEGVSAQGHSPVDRMTDSCKNITLPQLCCGQ